MGNSILSESILCCNFQVTDSKFNVSVFHLYQFNSFLTKQIFYLTFPVPVAQYWKLFTSWEFVRNQGQIESSKSRSFGKSMTNIAGFNLKMRVKILSNFLHFDKVEFDKILILPCISYLLDHYSRGHR